jgi:hypothetical protein
MGITILARMLLLISSVTLISLLALSKCGLSGALDNGLEEGNVLINLVSLVPALLRHTVARLVSSLCVAR